VEDPRYKFIEPQNVPLNFVHEGKNAFIIIPKVASSTLDTAFRHYLGWKNIVPAQRKPDWTWWGLVRHPVDRWVSGICQKYAPWTSQLDDASEEHMEYVNRLLHPNDIEWFVDYGWHDEHTQPQSWHYANAPHDNRKLYKLENMQDMWDDLGIKFPNPPDQQRLNAAEDRGDFGEACRRVWQILLVDPRLIRKLKDKYADDMELYENAS
tara:strand:- start:1151 stop:1777 length:627 start_codon:yes stop_codon:yes gene_type:complete